MAGTNPNGANQYHLDPRQLTCWEYYVSPKSETFGNAYQSAIKAGYEDTYAKTITVTEWFLEKVRRLNMLPKAEKVLEKALTMDVEDGAGKVDAGLFRIQADIAKHVTKTLGKHEGYSERQEIDHTSGGEPITAINYILPDGGDNTPSHD